MLTLLIVAGGKWQVPLVRKAKELGYYIINVNPFEDSPGFAYADETILCDVLDKESVLQAIQGKKIDGIVTDQSDIAVPTVAYLTEQLGLPGIGVEAAELFTNKYKMREFAYQLGFPMPRYTLAQSPEDLRLFWNDLTIVKPLNAQSSRGINIMHSADDAEAAYNEAANYTHDTTGVIAEEFVYGTEFTVDGIFIGGKHHTLAISRKEHFDFNPTIAGKLYFTPLIPELAEQHDRLMDATGVQLALTHSEYILHNGTYYLVEMAARGGGTLISSHIVPAVSGFDNYAILLAASTGQPIEIDFEDQVPSKTPFAVLSFFDHRDFAKPEREPGALHAAMEQVRLRPEVLDIDFEWDFTVQGQPDQPNDDRSRIGHVIIVGESEQEVMRVLTEVEAHLRSVLMP